MGCTCKTVSESCRSFQRYRHVYVTATLCPISSHAGVEWTLAAYDPREKRRLLPLHQTVPQLGAPLAKTVIAAHILTGDDCLSKVGIKHAAMPCDPVQYITNVGETYTLSDQYVVLTETYLVRVWAGAMSTTTAHSRWAQIRIVHFRCTPLVNAR